MGKFKSEYNEIIARDFVNYENPEQIAEDLGLNKQTVKDVLYKEYNIHSYRPEDIDFYLTHRHRLTEKQIMRSLTISKEALDRMKKDAKSVRLTHFGKYEKPVRSTKSDGMGETHAQINPQKIAR